MLRPIEHFPIEARRDILAVLTDIDDTLTQHGRLPPIAYDAMARLKAAGFIVVPVTGRPAGWCDLICRQWPVDGVVGENGAFYFRYDDVTRTLRRRYARTAVERLDDRRKLDRICNAVLTEVPGCAVAADQRYRECDLAIDFREDVQALSSDDVARILSVFESHGAMAKASSIHVNGWFGSYDKLTTSRSFMSEIFDLDLDAERGRFVFVGDSPNDAPMFGFFPNAVGVANVLDCVTELGSRPQWLTSQPSARGFAELADLLTAAR